MHSYAGGAGPGAGPRILHTPPHRGKAKEGAVGALSMSTTILIGMVIIVIIVPDQASMC